MAAQHNAWRPAKQPMYVNVDACLQSEEGQDATRLSGAATGQPDGADYSVSQLSRFFFVLGHMALQHLVSRPAAS